MLALKDTASSCDLGKAFLDLSSVIEGKLIFTKQSLMERGGHQKPGGDAPTEDLRPRSGLSPLLTGAHGTPGRNLICS